MACARALLMRRFHATVTMLFLAAALGCGREEREPLEQDIATAIADALGAAASIRVSGDRDAALAGRELSPVYTGAMKPYFDEAIQAHQAVIRTGVRYRDHLVDLQILDHCATDTTINVVARAFVRFDIEGPPGSPPFSAWEEEHVFRFSRDAEGLRMTAHHPITLAERKNREVYRSLRWVCRD